MDGMRSGEVSASHAGGMDAMSIDLNISGNTASAGWTWVPPIPTPPIGHTETLSARNACISANPGDTLTIDITALNIPASEPMFAFGLTINFDGSIFEFTNASARFMLGATPGSSVFDAGPTYDTNFIILSAADTNVDANETGSGVLERLELNVLPGASTGQHDLVLADAAHISSTDAQPPDVLNGATVAVGEPCPSPFGDVDCSAAVNSVDALKVLRFGAALSVTQNDPCVDMGQVLPNTELQGDVDCSNAVNSVDALKLLRFGAALSVSQNEPCPDIGT
jgi:hypothetical protein